MPHELSDADRVMSRVMRRWIAHVVAPQLTGMERAHAEHCARVLDRAAAADERERERNASGGT